MQQDSGVAAVAHVIQLSVAPVFLLSRIGAILGVMTNRIARIIDRGRALQQGTASFFLGLLLFLREIFLATRTLRIGVQHAVILEGREERLIPRGPGD